MKEEKESGYFMRQMGGRELCFLLKNLRKEELDCILTKLFKLETVIKVNIFRPIIKNLYCAIYFEVTKDVVSKYKIYGKIGIHFYCDNFRFRIQQGDSLRNTEYLFEKYGEIKPYYFLKMIFIRRR